MTGDTQVPIHLGLILDGNRRWAKAKGLPTLEGHRQGAETFKAIALAAFDRGVQYISAYAFSTENWQRTEEEVGYLMKLLIQAVKKHLKTFDDADIKIVVLGSRNDLDKSVLKALERAEEQTRHNTRGTLALCFNYGGTQELADAVKTVIANGTPMDEVTPLTVQQALYAPEIPDIDLLIRTSGEHRTSGFMLYRAAYAELYFTDTLWPDFTESELDTALKAYARRQRRFGA